MMKPQYPLIRVPTESIRLGIFEVLLLGGVVSGILLGSAVGRAWYGVVGAIAGGLLGGLIGLAICSLPKILFEEQMFRSMQRKSNTELKEVIEKGEFRKGEWTFIQTLALLNLQLRGEDVQSYLPRILTMLESDDWRVRLFGRDALRLVFTSQAVKIDDYDPHASTEECQRKVAVLRSINPPANQT
jgi:hypothetical protein